MRVRYDILSVFFFIAFYGYDFAIFWDIEGDALKREASAIRKRVKEILVIRE